MNYRDVHPMILDHDSVMLLETIYEEIEDHRHSCQVFTGMVDNAACLMKSSVTDDWASPKQVNKELKALHDAWNKLSHVSMKYLRENVTDNAYLEFCEFMTISYNREFGVHPENQMYRNQMRNIMVTFSLTCKNDRKILEAITEIIIDTAGINSSKETKAKGLVASL